MSRLSGACSTIGAALIALASSGCASLAFHQGAMPGEPPKATFAEIDGVWVRYEDKGEGPPVVLVHGFASSLENWLTVTPTLAKHHRVLSMDLKGFGWTDRPEGDYSPPAQAMHADWPWIAACTAGETILLVNWA